MKRRFAFLLSLLLLTAAGCTSNAQTGGIEGGSFVFVSPGGKAEFSYPADSRQTIGDFTGSSVTDPNTTIKLSDYGGKAMVLNVWGSWCGPCQGEAADLNVAAELSKDRPVQFLGINVKDDNRQPAADFIAGLGVVFPSIYDPTMRTLLSMRGFPTTTIPATIVLDRQHRVAHIYLRVVRAQELDQVVTALVAEPT